MYKRQDNIKMYLVIIALGTCGLDSSGSKQEPLADACEHGNELSIVVVHSVHSLTSY